MSRDCCNEKVATGSGNKKSGVSLRPSQPDYLTSNNNIQLRSLVVSAILCKSEDYLSEVSPKDKPWDVHKAQSEKIERLCRESGFEKYAARMQQCSGELTFRWDADMTTGETKLKLHRAMFCRVRTCPLCQWRRSLLWTHRMLSALPYLSAQYPNARFILLTLTVPNPPITELRATLKDMAQAWHRFQRFPEMKNVIGWTRATEVSSGNIQDYCHPHYHCLLMVPAEYFSGRAYVQRDRWLDMWKQAMRRSDITQVDVRAVRTPWAGVAVGSELSAGAVSAEMYGALPEVLKYATKSGDFLKAGSEWFGEYVRQVHKLRFLATGGVLKGFLKEDYGNNELIHPEGETPEGDGHKSVTVFDWEKPEKRYKKRK